jgi:nitrate/nitrite transporter NarK
VCQSSQALAYAGIALFLPLIRRDIGLSFAQAGTLAAASITTYALMQIPAGYLADRFGPKRLFLLGTVGTNLLALSFPLLSSYWPLVANQAVSGVFRALMFAPGMLLMSAQFPAGRRATAMGLYVAGGFSSNIFLNSLGPIFVRSLGWRTLFVIFAVFGLLMVALYWRVGNEGPPVDAAASPRLRELVVMLRQRVLWLCGVVQFVRLAVVQGINFWLPTYLVVSKGASLETAGLIVALAAAITAPANFFGGYLSDRLSRPLVIIGTAVAVLACTLVALPAAQSLPLVIVIVAVQAVFVQVYFGPLFEVPIRKLGARVAGVTSGFSNMCANLGGLTFAYTLGAVKDATGSFDIGFYAMAAMCVLALAATFLLGRLPDSRLPSVSAET